MAKKVGLAKASKETRKRVARMGGKARRTKSGRSGGRLSNIGNYYFDYLPIKGKRRTTGFFTTLSDAVKEAKKRQRNKKILQADFFVVKNAISDIQVANLDLSGNIRAGM